MIRKKKRSREIVIDLTGPDGNVFVLMAYARKLARHVRELHSEELELNRDRNRVLVETGMLEEGVFPESLEEQIIGEMMSSDYENAVQVFDRYFGSFVVLER